MHVRAPGVHLEAVAAEARDAVDDEERRMPGRVERPRSAATSLRTEEAVSVCTASTARIACPRSAVSRSAIAVGVDRRLEARVDHLDLDPHLPRRRRPAEPEAPARRHQRLVARREQVGDRGLPAGMAVADVDRDLAGGARHPLQVADHPLGQGDQLALVDVRRRAMHRLQHPVGDHRRPGNGEDVAATRERHGKAPDRLPPEVTGPARGRKWRIPLGRGAGPCYPARRGRRARPRPDPPMPDAPASPSASPWWRLWRDWLAPHWPLLAVSLAMTWLVALATGGYSKLIQLVMTAFQDKDASVLWWGPLGVDRAERRQRHRPVLEGGDRQPASPTGWRPSSARPCSPASSAPTSRALQTEAPAGLAARFSSDIGLIGTAVRSMLGGVTGILTIIVTVARHARRSTGS